MKPERWQQVDQLFHGALERAPHERVAYLEQACAGDDELRRQVEVLLAAYDRAGSFIERPALEVEAQMIAHKERLSAEDGVEYGETIDHYRIIERLGSGGMSDVYLAQDLKLGRRVALKLLPRRFTEDAARLRRFEQEARAASALNHPNILTIYEIGKAGSTPYIATEFVDGMTLRAYITGKTLKNDETISLVIQIGNALAAAHDKGIIHRDIKPENIMLSRGKHLAQTEGHVKVLDFGIAKLMDADVLQTEMPTRPIMGTIEGIAIGTIPYMSPEQLRGEAVDARTDIWSLGIVLYEMLSGRLPFNGETSPDLHAAILKDDLSPLPAEVSDALKSIVRNALRKDRAQRYQNIGEMLVDLQRLQARVQANSQPEPLAASSMQAEVTRPLSGAEYISKIRSHKRGAAIVIALLVLGIVGTVISIKKFRVSGPRAIGVPFQSAKITRLTSSGKVKDAAISPDGKYVAYVEAGKGQQSIWVKHVPTGTTVPVVPAADVNYFGLTFSNDSDHIYFVVSTKDLANWKLYEVSVLGGVARKVLEHIDSAVTFSPDGKRFAFLRGYLGKGESELIVANGDGTQQQIIATRKQPDFFNSTGLVRPAWSPDGKLIACAAGGKDASGWYQNVVGVQIENGAERALTNRRWTYVSHVAWLSDGSGFTIIGADEEEWAQFSHPQLWHVSYPGGEAHTITNDLNSYKTVSVAADSRTLIITQVNQSSNIWLAPKGDTGRARQLTSGTIDGIRGLTWTTDGKIVYRSMASGTSQLWLMNADGTNQRQLTYEGYNADPAVSNDGQYIFFTSHRSGKDNIWRMDVDGGNQRQLTDRQGGVPVPAPDGRWVFYNSLEGAKLEFWKVPVDGGESALITTPPGLNGGLTISPSGKQIATSYWDEQLDRHGGVMIFPSEGGAPSKRLKITFDYEAVAWALVWAPDGQALLSIDADRANIWSYLVDGSKPTRLTDFQGDELFNFAYSRDGNWLAVARGRITEDVVMFTELN